MSPAESLSQSAAADVAPQPRPLLEIRDLKVHFRVKRRTLLGVTTDVVHAVDGVNLSIARGETLGLVGESGCGKSTLGRAVLALYRPTAGQVLLGGLDLSSLEPHELRQQRKRFQIVFQDPFSSLNPRLTIGRLIREALEIHHIGEPEDRDRRVSELMELVGLRPSQVTRYPHEFSGGQKQRIAIARALASDPELVVLDEPVSALDVSIQAQILRLLSDLQKRLGLTYLLIAHDLAVVGQMSQRIAVMYLGKIVELGARQHVYENTSHPYTRALFSAVPYPDPKIESTRKRILLSGDLPSPINPPAGCRFSSRCPFAVEICRREEPLLLEVHPDHLVACHRVGELGAIVAAKA